MNSEIIIYQNPEGNIKIDVRLEDETVWLTQAQLCELFQKSKATISEHIKNVFEEGELDASATVRKFRTVQMEGNRNVEREIDHYNLDVIISVGYRVKSPQGMQFRIWAFYNSTAENYSLTPVRLVTTKRFRNQKQSMKNLKLPSMLLKKSRV